MFGKGLKIVFLFSLLFLFYVVGSLIFTKGFLLSRVVVDRNSSCQVDFAEFADDVAHGKAGCWLHRRFDKAIIIIIDALRFDFMAPVRDSSSASAPYLNKLPTLQNFIDSKPMNARLFKFLADPPTTTLQRLKGLTTGSLPTFVDAGSNFASTEITEDNFIDQLVKKGKKFVFMGDDTWINLFPGRFYRQFPYPSFNVKDLNTVDDGILSHLYGEIRSKDWDVVIAHFLGVDHCGHTYGPNNPAMTTKLTQMDQMIRNVTALLGEDTILFVMGDHGMTGTGDHGGDSLEELSSGLFVYSPAQITASKFKKDVYPTVSQTDFVPTISLLLGVPIPFSNLGTVISDLLNFCTWSKDSHIKEVYHTIEAVRLNAVQMSLYLEAYMKVSSDLSDSQYDRLQKDLKQTEQQLQDLVTDLFIHGHAEDAHGRLHHLLKKYLRFTGEAREMCKDVWAKFDLTYICLGILVILVSLGINVFMLKTTNSLYDTKGSVNVILCMAMAVIFIVYSGIQTFYFEGKSSTFIAFFLGLIDIIAVVVIIKKIKHGDSQNIKHLETLENAKDGKKAAFSYAVFLKIFSIVVFVGLFLSFFSNSYVVYEDRIASFFAQTLIWMFFIYCAQQVLIQTYTKERKSKLTSTSYDIIKTLTQPLLLVFFLTVCCSISLRISNNFRACREEQINCTLSQFLQPLSSLGKTVEGSKNIRYFTSAASLIVLQYLLRKWLRYFGNLNGNILPVICFRFLLPVAVVCCIFHWAVEGLSDKTVHLMAAWQQTLFAQIVYGIVILSLVSVIVSPLLVYILPQYGNTFTVPSETKTDFLIQKVHNYMKLNWESLSGESHQIAETGDKPPVVYGLGTVYSSAIVYVGSILYILVALLLGDGFSPSLLLSGLTVFFFIELYTVAVKLREKEDLLGPGILIICLLSAHFFYATGHHATIPSIRFEAAFVGFHGNWNIKVIPAMLIFLNTYAMEVILTWLSPLLVLSTSLKGFVAPHILRTRDDKATTKGELLFYESPEMFLGKLTTLVSYTYIFKGVKLFGAMLAAFIHRRHLMVWKIFAPRFVFQALSSFCVFGVSILSLMFMIRVQSALSKWMQKLNTKSE